ncbi:MAG: hypothetical protein ACI92C_002092 [Neolewinella sp.]|jgi:hypothetical protein
MQETKQDWQYAPRSQDMEEIINRPPSWITLYGTIFMVVCVFGLALMSYLYEYPDTVSGDLVLTTIDPPRPLEAPDDFPIARLLVANEDSVRAREVLMVARSLATFNDVFELSERLSSNGDQSNAGLSNFFIPPDWNLGEVQEAVYELQNKQEMYRNLRDRRLDGLTTRELETRIGRQERFIRDHRQLQIRLEDLIVRNRSRLKREAQLSTDGVDNRNTLNTARRNVEQTEDELNASRSEVRAASFDIELMRNQIDSYRGGLPSSLNQAGEDLRTAYGGLKAAVAGWENNYTITSPVDGLVLLNRDIRPGRTLLRGTSIGMVLPANAGGVIGRIDLPNKGSGAVAVGQRVLVRFDSYPYLEYGSVEGKVISIGRLPIGGITAVEVTFPNELNTTTGNRLEPGPLMEGEASIITESRSLLQRFFKRR